MRLWRWLIVSLSVYGNENALAIDVPGKAIGAIVEQYSAVQEEQVE